MKNKKILIISHNPLSQVNNNGKTLVSIFRGICEENIYQIYLTSEISDYSDKCHYLQINEKQILKSVLKAKNICCQEVCSTPGRVSSTAVRIKSWGIHAKRLLRECIWKTGIWKQNLREWLRDKRFEVVFFMAGDGVFAYDVYNYVMKHVKSKGCIFFTDDYIIGKTSSSPLALLRRIILKRKIIKTLPLVHDFYVISDEMKKEYDKLFSVDSYVIRNFSVEKKDQTSEKSGIGVNEDLIMVYAGGLHYNRWKVLSIIADKLKIINLSSKTQCKLKIFSSQSISADIIDKIAVKDTSMFCGGVSASQIAELYANSDILLHVESFDKKSIASTKYSFSTKIPEYLSSGKCVLAVGPSEIASMKYLSDFACVICDENELLEKLTKLTQNEEYRRAIKMSCDKRYESDFSPEIQEKCLQRIVSNQGILFEEVE